MWGLGTPRPGVTSLTCTDYCTHPILACCHGVALLSLRSLHMVVGTLAICSSSTPRALTHNHDITLGGYNLYRRDRAAARAICSNLNDKLNVKVVLARHEECCLREFHTDPGGAQSATSLAPCLRFRSATSDSCGSLLLHTWHPHKNSMCRGARPR